MSDQSAPLLAIIPARGNSRRIPKKVLQPVAGRPLLLHTLETVKQSGVADRIVVSTEDADIAAFARLRGYEVVDRPAELAQDTSTISQVAEHAVSACDWTGILAVFQPTCPLLRPETVEQIVAQFRRTNFDWAITGTKARHLLWQNGYCLTPRVNSQQLATESRAPLVESGAIQLWRLPFKDQPIRTVLEIPPDEALDIDTHADLCAARLELGRKRIRFHVAVGTEVGTGHFWRCLQLADALSHHAVSFVFDGESPEWARDIVDARGYLIMQPSSYRPDLLVVDALDAADAIVPRAKADGVKVVLLEHDGPATQFADLVIDEFADPRHMVLRPEFVALPEERIEPNKTGSRVLVTFGGTDPSKLGARFASMLAYALDAEVRVVQGPGAVPIDAAPFKAGRAVVVENANMAEQMCWADLVITSQGRTVAEAAACGAPVVSISANERESRHVKLPGVIYLGLHVTLADSTFLDTVSRLLDRPALRAEMSRTARAAIDGKGLSRIVHRIEGLLADL